MGDLPFFSILTASLNNGASIEQTISSVRTQTYKNYEHIVIDGGSTDSTVNILRQAGGTYPLSWISEPDQGIAEALNKGLPMARGQYIFVIQADDQFLNPDILGQVYPLLSNEKIDILSYPVVMQDAERGIVFRDTIRCRWWNHFKFIFQHQGCFVHRRVFEKIGNFREELKIALDYDFFYRALKNKCSVRFEKLPVVMMGGEGIGSQEDNIPFRIKEEGLVHRLNERNKVWRLAQYIFRMLYVPYKTKLLPIKRSLMNKFER